MNLIDTTIVAAIIGAVAGGATSYVLQQQNLSEARISQQQELDAWSGQWKEANSKTDVQLAYMKDSISQMQKAIEFEKDKHATEMEAVRQLIASNYENAEMLLMQAEKSAQEAQHRFAEKKDVQKRAKQSNLLSELFRAARALRVEQVFRLNAKCIFDGIDLSEAVPMPDCTPVRNAERNEAIARTEFQSKKMAALSNASPALKNDIENVSTMLEAVSMNDHLSIEQRRKLLVPEKDFEQAIITLSSKVR